MGYTHFSIYRPISTSMIMFLHPLLLLLLSSIAKHYLRQINVIGWAMLYGPILFCAKLSLFLLYLRMFSPSRPTKYSIYLGITSIALVYISTTAAIGALCIPRPGKTWLETADTPGCANNATITIIIQGVFNVISDLYLFLIPFVVVYQLQLPKKKKLGIYAIFAIGLL